jgi:hypothetical protein
MAVFSAARAAEESPRWSASGLYVEACTCGVPCGCVVKGEASHGCQGLNIFRFDSGRWGDVPLSGVRVAVGHQPGGWGIYYFAPGTTEAQQKAVQKILEPRDRAFGLTIEAVKTAPIEITGEDGNFQVRVGEVGRITTQPVLGLDKKQPIGYRNLPDPFVRDSFQGRSVSGTFKDAGHEFEMNGTNAFWSRFRLKG